MSHAPSSPNRRNMLLGLGAVVGGVAGSSLLSACGGGDAGGSAPARGSGKAAPAGPLATVSSIPDGGTIAVENPDGGTVLLTRNGTAVTGLDAKCTHQGCTVAIKDGVLACPCHGSNFALGTGAVLNGPASTPLAPVRVNVAGNDVTLAS